MFFYYFPYSCGFSDTPRFLKWLPASTLNIFHTTDRKSQLPVLVFQPNQLGIIIVQAPCRSGKRAPPVAFLSHIVVAHRIVAGTEIPLRYRHRIESASQTPTKVAGIGCVDVVTTVYNLICIVYAGTVGKFQIR